MTIQASHTQRHDEIDKTHKKTRQSIQLTSQTKLNEDLEKSHASLDRSCVQDHDDLDK